MQVLSRVLAYGVDHMGVLNHNACEGIKRLYSGERSEIIWTGADIEQLKKHCTKEIGHAVDLAAHTGLRARTVPALVVARRRSRHRDPDR